MPLVIKFCCYAWKTFCSRRFIGLRISWLAVMPICQGPVGAVGD